ncbi:hypothetical protein ACGFMO_32515 [Streptomyces niveus]|uniref:hypothetical protein n=1 Tax=Streptomyces niveus TaxID=193462 RepID=UPI003721680E
MSDGPRRVRSRVPCPNAVISSNRRTGSFSTTCGTLSVSGKAVLPSMAGIRTSRTEGRTTASAPSVSPYRRAVRTALTTVEVDSTATRARAPTAPAATA